MSANPTTQQTAERLIALCRENKWEQAQKELYAEDAVSIEPSDTPGSVEETRGLKAIAEKGRKWAASVEKVHKITVSDPVVAGGSFACTMRLDLTMKGRGRMDVAELCIYDVKGGKVVSEQFRM